MNKKSLLKIFTVIAIIALIMMQLYKIEATSSFQEFLGENGENSSLNTNIATNNTANNVDNNVANNTANNTVNNTVNNTSNTNNTKLPQTGTNENILIGLIVVFSVVGVYTFKKVRDYNI